jgi:hypothetical protein
MCVIKFRVTKILSSISLSRLALAIENVVELCYITIRDKTIEISNRSLNILVFISQANRQLGKENVLWGCWQQESGRRYLRSSVVFVTYLKYFLCTDVSISNFDTLMFVCLSVDLSRNVSVGVLTRMGGRRIAVLFPVEARDYLCSPEEQTGFDAQTSSN